MKWHRTFFQNSLLILFVFEMVTNYYTAADGSAAKMVFNLNIYLSLYFLILINFKPLLFDLSRFAIISISLLIGYGLFSIIRDIPQGEYFSLFGNPLYGPSFLVPLFILWGTRYDSLYWLHRISILVVKIGVLLTPIAQIFKLDLPYIAFLPTFFLILNYKYAPNKDRIWILLSSIVGSYVFYSSDIRSGIIRILIGFVIFLIVSINFKSVNRYFAILMITFPIFALYHGINSGKNILSEALIFINSEFVGSDDLTDDTRTFLFIELLTDLNETGKLTFGKGPLGTYYSEYFYNNEGDNFIRHDVEVGVLSYLLRGGIIYLILVYSTIIIAIYNGIKHSNNKYTISLSLVLSTFLFYSFIENIPSYSFYISSIWIIVGLCISKKFVLLNDSQIKNLIRYKELSYHKDNNKIIFNVFPKSL